MSYKFLFQRHAEVIQALVNKGYPESIKNLSLVELDRIQQLDHERIMHPAIYPLGEMEDLLDLTVDDLEARIDSCLELASDYERNPTDDFWERLKFNDWAERVMEVAGELDDLIDYRNDPPTW